MNSLLRPLVSGNPAAEQFRGLPTQCKDPLMFTWWLLVHVAMLAQYDRNGTPQTEVRKHNVIMRGFVECKYQHVVNRATLRTYTSTPGKTPVTHLEEFTFSLVCLYMILHLKLLQFSNLDATQELIHEFPSDFLCIAITLRNIQHTYMHCLDIITYRWW